MAPLIVRVARVCSLLIPRAYRDEVTSDLLDEYLSTVRRRRGRIYGACWVLAHIARSAIAARRLAPGGPSGLRERRLLLDELACDWRLARRSLRRSPLFTVVALITLVVSIGLSTAVFSLTSGVLLEPLPYPSADRLVRLAQFSPEADAEIPATGGELAAVTVGLWKEQASALEAIVPYVAGNSETVGIGGTVEQMAVASVDGRFFELLGARPEAGRLLTLADSRPGEAPVAVVSRRVWSQLFGQRADAIGAVITIDNVPHTIVGVAPASIDFPSDDIDVWKPGQWTFPPPGRRASFSFSYDVIARMRSDATIDDVRREGERVLGLIAMADPAFADGTVDIPRLRVVSLQADIVAAVRPALNALFAGMALVFVAACVSLANLLVARNSARVRDLAIRATLGSTRTRLLRPLVLELFVLVGAGAVLGGLVGRWILDALPAIAPAVIPRVDDLRFDWTAFVVTTGLSLVTALIVGLRAGRSRTEKSLRELSASQRLAGRGGSRSAEAFRGALVAAQVALAVVLLVGASLIGRSLWQLVHTHVGYDPAGVLTFQLGENPATRRTAGGPTRFHEGLLERLRGLPGVTAAAVGSRLPLHGGFMSGGLSIVGEPPPTDPANRLRTNMVMVSLEYHRALRTGLIEGRLFEAADFVPSGEPVAIVDELLARRLGGRAIGKRVRAFGPRTWTIVGVVEALRLGAVRDGAEPIMYFPSAHIPESFTYNRSGSALLVRTSSDPASLAPAIRELVRAADPLVPVFNLMPLADRLDATFDQPRFYTIALALFASMALVTAVLGVYGVQAYAVERRTAEIGVRRALGAREGDITRLVFTRALLLGLAGAAIGIPLAAAGAGLLEALLYGVRPIDPLTFAAVPVVVLLLALAASWQPARRALRVDPSAALRCE